MRSVFSATEDADATAKTKHIPRVAPSRRGIALTAVARQERERGHGACISSCAFPPGWSIGSRFPELTSDQARPSLIEAQRNQQLFG